MTLLEKGLSRSKPNLYIPMSILIDRKLHNYMHLFERMGNFIVQRSITHNVVQFRGDVHFQLHEGILICAWQHFDYTHIIFSFPISYTNTHKERINEALNDFIYDYSEILIASYSSQLKATLLIAMEQLNEYS